MKKINVTVKVSDYRAEQMGLPRSMQDAAGVYFMPTEVDLDKLSPVARWVAERWMTPGTFYMETKMTPEEQAEYYKHWHMTDREYKDHPIWRWAFGWKQSSVEEYFEELVNVKADRLRFSPLFNLNREWIDLPKN